MLFIACSVQPCESKNKNGSISNASNPTTLAGQLQLLITYIAFFFFFFFFFFFLSYSFSHLLTNLNNIYKYYPDLVGMYEDNDSAPELSEAEQHEILTIRNTEMVTILYYLMFYFYFYFYFYLLISHIDCGYLYFKISFWG